MGTVFISDTKFRMAVPAIRAFGRQGHTVVALEYDDTPPRACLGFYSRYVSRTLRLPREEEAFCAALARAAADCPEKPSLLAFGRHTLGILSRHRALEQVLHLLVPTPEALALADDKHTVLQRAKALDIPVPFTATAAEFPSPERLAEAAPLPCVVKYRNGEALGLHAAQRYRIVSDRAVLLRVHGEMAARQPLPLVQEYIAGDGLGVCLVMDKQQQVTDFICHRRIREYPVSGGPSCCCETIFSRPLLQMAHRLLADLDFTGVAMVEFKGTVDRPFLMEINPRFWGSSPLIDVAGSCFYESVAKTAVGQAVPLDLEVCQPAYRVGQRMGFFPQDLLALPGTLKKSQGKAACLGGYLRDLFSPRVRDGLFSWRDPRPFFQYLFCSR